VGVIAPAGNARVVDLCCGMGGLSVAARDLGMRVVAGARGRVFGGRFSVFGGNFPEAEAIEGSVRSGTVLAKKHGHRLESFREVLAEAGYHVVEKVLDSSEYGVPQKRKRAFFFVTRRPLDPQRIGALLVRHKLSPVATRYALHDPVTCRSGRSASHGSARMCYPRIPNTDNQQPSSFLPGPMSYRRLHPTKPANTLFSGHRAPPAHFAEPRSITVREAARLQGFPDTFHVYGSFANQMQQVTNAVPRHRRSGINGPHNRRDRRLDFRFGFTDRGISVIRGCPQANGGRNV
jgi:DNA (cytosine-5)-methyltransferase 1